jgi:hypothetical protein
VIDGDHLIDDGRAWETEGGAEVFSEAVSVGIALGTKVTVVDGETELAGVLGSSAESRSTLVVDREAAKQLGVVQGALLFRQASSRTAGGMSRAGEVHLHGTNARLPAHRSHDVKT